MNERIGWRTPEPLLATELEDDAAPPRRVVAPGKRTLTEGLRRAEDVPSVVPGRDGAATRAAGPRPLAARGTSPMAIVDPFDFLDEAAARADAARAVVAEAARDLGVTPTIHVGEATGRRFPFVVVDSPDRKCPMREGVPVFAPTRVLSETNIIRLLS